ncbi:MAG: preprotein translocase subunit SecA [Cellvibrionaceae bacterium]|jgi:preprotein translocase subunit SecA
MKAFTGDPNKKVIDDLRPLVDEVEGHEARLLELSDDELREITQSYKEQLSVIEDDDELDNAMKAAIPEIFALVREGSRRTTTMRHYDVQIMGGILLNDNGIIEMRTGEGKTLVGTLPLFLNALTGRGAHLVTVNDYLVRRDGGWMGQIFSFLGLSVGVIGSQQFSGLYDPNYVDPGAELEDDRLVHWRPSTRREAYMADITYGTSSEFGFDYLRDNMVNDPARLVQREHFFAIIDEVDNVLIDEARTPLIISGPANQASDDYIQFSQYVRGLKRNTAEDDDEPNGHYDLDEKSKSITLTDMGTEAVERKIPDLDPEDGDSIYDPRFYHYTYYLDNALKAQYMFKNNKDYAVLDNEVVIIDDFTGRMMPGRRYSDGLHEAIEAKEGVTVKRESVTVATITIQNYFRLYTKLAGMTGTAMTDAEEFQAIYKVEVTPLPTNVAYLVEHSDLGIETKKEKIQGADAFSYYKPGESKAAFYKRIDFPDQIFANEEFKDRAIIEEVKRVSASQRPVLVGTTSVEHSEKIHEMLKAEGVKHNVLNAKIHQSEALIVAQAGKKSAVTISTNMAGRGTDILLGGNPEGLAAAMVEETLFTRDHLVALAQKFESEGDTKAREYASKSAKLDPALIDVFNETKVEFDKAAEEIAEAQVVGYLARIFQEEKGLDYETARTVLSMIQIGNRNGAREFLKSKEIDTIIVDEAVRLTGLHSRYQVALKDQRKMAEFLADQVFDYHYKARAAVARAVLEGETAEAEKLTAEIPALPVSMITDIQKIMSDADSGAGEVWDLGGLHVIGSERHESRRIDNQLRGRAARQGDPGSSRFFLSLEDELMRRFGGERLKSFMSSYTDSDTPIESRLLDRIIASSQERIEGYNFDIRKNVLEYDDVMAKQRETIYEERRAILTGDADMDGRLDGAFEIIIDELVSNYLDDYLGFIGREVDRAVDDFSAEATDSVNLKGVFGRLQTYLPVRKLDIEDMVEWTPDEVRSEMMALAQENLEEGRNLYQMLQEMSRFIPLLPAIPRLDTLLAQTKTNHMQVKQNAQVRFLGNVRSVFDNFLADFAAEDDKNTLWAAAETEISEAFSQFSTQRGTSNMELLKGQQERFRITVREALQDLLVNCLSALDSDALVEALGQYVDKERINWKKRIGEESFTGFQRVMMLSAIDREWRDYLSAADDLRREIGLESAGRQKDPKIAYKMRSYEMFDDMRNNIEREIASKFFIQIQRHEEYMRREKAEQDRQNSLSKAGLQLVQTRGKKQEMRRDALRVGRNDSCPCGSGKKYKNCHMKSEESNMTAVTGAAPTQRSAAPQKAPVSNTIKSKRPQSNKKKRKR